MYIHVLFMQHAFFEELGVSTLRYLDTVYEKGEMERSQYFKNNLSRVITKLPKVELKQLFIIPLILKSIRVHLAAGSKMT